MQQKITIDRDALINDIGRCLAAGTCLASGFLPDGRAYQIHAVITTEEDEFLDFDATPSPAQPPVNGEEGQTVVKRFLHDQGWLHGNSGSFDYNGIVQLLELFLSSIAPPASPAKAEQDYKLPIYDLSGLDEAEKQKFATEAMKGATEVLMATFYSLGCSNHLDQMSINDANGDEFIMAFRKIVDGKLLGPVLEFAAKPKAEQEGPTKDDLRERIEANQHANMPLSEAEFQAAYCEGIDKGYEKAKREQEGLRWVKGEYDRLYAQAKGGKRTVCYVDYELFPGEPSRDICTLKALPEHLEFVSRGHGYASIWDNQSVDRFVKICEHLKVEWLLESAPKEAGQVDPATVLNWLQGQGYFDYTHEHKSGEELLAEYIESLNKQQ